MRKLPCCIEAGPTYAPKARYALSMLLLPLGLGPVWVRRDDLTGPGLYYGANPEDLPGQVVALQLGAGVEEYFDQPTQIRSDGVRWHQFEELRFPVLFAEDQVASAFFWLSGWQEYYTRQRDAHGRFPHNVSLQKALGITTLPVVDIYRRCLRDELKRAGIDSNMRKWGGTSWVMSPTIDVDYLRKWRKGIVYRELVEYFLLNSRAVRLRDRVGRLLGSTRQALGGTDPFIAALDRMNACIKSHGSGTVFLKTSAHGPKDVHYSLRSKYMHRLIARSKRDDFEIGLHPSYHAHNHPDYLREERRLLLDLTGSAPISVRQHYLRFVSPATPRLQVANGFRIDSTLGFATQVGFRHGTCMPFRHFDVVQNKALDLWEMPLAVMDSALFNRQNLSASEAVTASKEILQMCARFGGIGVILWHNVLWDELDFPGWGDHFEAILQWAAESGGGILSLRSALESWLGYPLGTQSARAV